MKTQNLALLISVIVIIAIAAIASTVLLSSATYKNITLNDVQMEVKDSNVTVTNQTEHYSMYNDTENGILVLVFDSEGSDLGDVSEMVSYAAIRDVNQVGAQLQSQSNFSYNYSDTLKQYTYLTNYTHKNVFVVTKNKDDMEHILSTIKVTAVSLTLNDTEETTTVRYVKPTTSTDNKSEDDSATNDTPNPGPDPDPNPIDPEPGSDRDYW